MTPLLSLSEAAQRLACSSTTIRRLVANGVLPVVRIGRLIRIDPADLTAMIYAQKAQPVFKETLCRSTSADRSGGCGSQRQTDKTYGKLLKLPTSDGRKNSMTAAKRSCGINSDSASGFKYAEQLQAEDRNHRIGQSHKVTYINLWATCKIEERIYNALASKGNALDRFREEVDKVKASRKEGLKKLLAAL